MSNFDQTNDSLVHAPTDVATVSEDGQIREKPAKRRGANLWLGLLRNRKAQIGLFFLLFFLVLAVIPGLIAPYSPSYEGFLPSLAPSGAHWLGTTSFGQDIFSQLVW